MGNNMEFVLAALKTFEGEQGVIFWRFDENDKVTFFVDCSDLFCWACSDAEEIENSEDLALYNECKSITSKWAEWLYAARKRKMRPQGACYKYFDETLAAHFNACGAEREVGFGNPYSNEPGNKNRYHKDFLPDVPL